jgi:hypothetical protein
MSSASRTSAECFAQVEVVSDLVERQEYRTARVYYVSANEGRRLYTFTETMRAMTFQVQVILAPKIPLCRFVLSRLDHLVDFSRNFERRTGVRYDFVENHHLPLIHNSRCVLVFFSYTFFYLRSSIE